MHLIIYILSFPKLKELCKKFVDKLHAEEGLKPDDVHVPVSPFNLSHGYVRLATVHSVVALM